MQKVSHDIRALSLTTCLFFLLSLMADQDSSSPNQPASSLSAAVTEIVITSPLKFLMTNLKLIVHTQLTVENYAI